LENVAAARPPYLCAYFLLDQAVCCLGVARQHVHPVEQSTILVNDRDTPRITFGHRHERVEKPLAQRDLVLLVDDKRTRAPAVAVRGFTKSVSVKW
jgi:hypothetical protein